MTSLLDGITVLDITRNLAGPYATLVLSDLGARVIKIEDPLTGDDARAMPPFVNGLSAVFASLNRGKESVALNLKTPEGKRIALRLAMSADVFVENLRPGKVEELGLGWEDLCAINPRLIYCSINAFGRVGPLAGLPGYDAILQAYAGIMDLTGYPRGKPARVGTGIIDFGTGLWAAIGILAALLERDRTGSGRKVEVTMLGTAVSLLIHHLVSARLAGVVPRRLGTAQHNLAPYEAVRVRDGLVMIGVGNDQLWQRLCDAIDDGRLKTDPRFRSNASRVANRRALIATIEALTMQYCSEELVRRLWDYGVPASMIRNASSLIADPQVAALDLWQQDPAGVPYPVIPVHIDNSSIEIKSPPPELGQHTREVMRKLGYLESEMRILAEKGMVAMQPEG